MKLFLFLRSNKMEQKRKYLPKRGFKLYASKVVMRMQQINATARGSPVMFDSTIINEEIKLTAALTHCLMLAATVRRIFPFSVFLHNKKKSDMNTHTTFSYCLSFFNCNLFFKTRSLTPTHVLWFAKP